MNEEQISQTLLDQMVSSDRGQMIKAAIPYLPPKGQQIFSVYEKAVEFINTVSVFSKRSSGSDLCAMSMPAQNPVDIVNDIRSFCYGPSRDKLNQMVNMMAMVQMLRLMNQPADWRNNPKLAGMDRSKLDMLQNLASQGSSKGANEMLPFLMNAAAQGKKGGLKFNADEISAIIEVLKMGKSPAEAQKLDKVVNLMKMMR